jgi:outer membrane lipoprotein carrier protein
MPSFIRLLAGLLVLAPVPAAAQNARGADSLARALQQRYEGVRDFSAEFSQSYRGGILRTETRERGTVAIKKPGRMRWVYTDPERKEFVSDGTRIYSYIPEDRQVIVSSVPAGNDASTPVLFLTGRGDLVRDFRATLTDSPIEGTVALQLTPHRDEPEYEYLVVAVDPSSLQIRGLVTRDRQGGLSTLRFDKLQENTGISDKEFAFQIPRGVDVITDGPRN